MFPINSDSYAELESLSDGELQLSDIFVLALLGFPADLTRRVYVSVNS